MSTRTKENLDDFFKWISRGAILLVCTLFFEMRSDIKVLLSDYSAFIEWKVDVNRRLDGHDTRLDRHAEAINKIKTE